MSGKRQRKGEAGFTLMETMIAVLILAVGVLALGAILGDGLAYMGMAQDEYIAEQKAAETIESVYTARDVSQTSWGNINNASNAGIFVDGPTQLCDPGPDGILGTADDDCTKPDVIYSPGPDGLLGTADDVKIPLSSFTRTILIQAIANRPDLRQVTITIAYQAAKFKRTYVLVTNISQYS
ncbi:MAG TPA: prepilin-type N-terminal cleavage/methylation domain-containing protein [Candidatus Acidoferrales bacterium]